VVIVVRLNNTGCHFMFHCTPTKLAKFSPYTKMSVRSIIKSHRMSVTRWLYCVECPQYSTRRRSASNIYIFEYAT